MDKKLSERKQKVLKAVVDEYIKNATPVSSGEIKAKYFDDVSSATIRSELSTLEDMGFLVQPHTSAGRVPAPSAYRFYVDHFLDRRPLRKQDIVRIDQGFGTKFAEIEELVKTTAKVISDVTNYTSVIVLKNINKVLIKEIKIVGLDRHTALVIIITDRGIIRDKVITVTHPINDGFLSDANVLLNRIFVGKRVGDLKNSDLIVEKELEEFRELLESVVAILESCCENNESDIYMEGESKMLDYPEADLQSAKNFLTIIDNKTAIADLIEDSDIEFNVKIGREETGGIDRCAIITAKYTVNGKELGHAGVIGPERMDYAKVISVLSYVGRALETIIKPQGDNDEE